MQDIAPVYLRLREMGYEFTMASEGWRKSAYMDGKFRRGLLIKGVGW